MKQADLDLHFFKEEKEVLKSNTLSDIVITIGKISYIPSAGLGS